MASPPSITAPPTATRRGPLRRWLRRLLVLAALAVLGVAGLALALVLIYPLPSDLNAYIPAPSTRIFDRHGQLLYEFVGPGGRRTTLPLATIPPALRQATLAAEDATFYRNPGIDPLAIARSLLLDARLGRAAYGGSTITQQLVRTVLLGPDEREQRTIGRKLHEVSLALQLTARLSKDRILALYLNNVYYGDLSYGVEAASEAYFGRPVAALDLAQCALLAGIPRSPSAYNPLLHPARALARRRDVLRLLRARGSIGAEQERLANAEQLGLAGARQGILAPHFVLYVASLLEARYGRDALERGGLQVTTSLDLNMQRLAEADVRRHVDALRADHLVHDGALVAIDPGTGQILALVGSADYNDRRIDGAVDVALALRQPGSAIKPFTYAAAFARDYTPATLLDDAPTAFTTAEGQPFQPLNYDLQFHGPVTLRTALANSYNVPAVKVLAHVGIPAMLAVAHAAGITTMNDVHRYGLALTLGGGEVRLLDLTSAYGTFAAAGVHHEPVAILSVADARGRTLDAWQPTGGRRAVSPQVAYLISSILSDNAARMPEFGADSPLALDRPAAAKTGTTSDFHDNWTVGYTPDLVAGVWVGNADNTAMRDVTGVSGAAPVWHDFMEDALRDLPARDFVVPPRIAHETICPGSGLPPDAGCTERRDEVFIADTQPRAARPSAPAAAITLTAPASGSQFQISLSVPRAYQATSVDARAAGIAPGTLEILVDGSPAHRLPDAGGEWLWPLREGTHRFWVVGHDRADRPVESAIATITVIGPQNPP